MAISRRRTLQTAVGAALTSGMPVLPALAAPTPNCADVHQTAENDEGPYFKPSSPLRADLFEPGLKGEKLIISGRVTSLNCLPFSRALIDFWQADASGEYDNDGFRLRGHQFTDAAGNYRLETIVPGIYPGRTRHIHVKVVAPAKIILTTQLYFPNEPFNARDRLFRKDLVVDLVDGPPEKTARFDFVLNFM